MRANLHVGGSCIIRIILFRVLSDPKKRTVMSTLLYFSIYAFKSFVMLTGKTINKRKIYKWNVNYFVKTINF